MRPGHLLAVRRTVARLAKWLPRVQRCRRGFPDFIGWSIAGSAPVMQARQARYDVKPVNPAGLGVIGSAGYFHFPVPSATRHRAGGPRQSDPVRRLNARCVTNSATGKKISERFPALFVDRLDAKPRYVQRDQLPPGPPLFARTPHSHRLDLRQTG